MCEKTAISSSEDGFTLLGVLIGCAILSMVFFGFSTFILNSSRANLVAESVRASQGVEGAMQSHIVKNVARYMNNECRGRFKFSKGNLGDSVKVRLSGKIKRRPKFKKEFNEAANRCRNGGLLRPKGSGRTKAHSLYFCLNLSFPKDKENATLAPSAFGASDFGFVEVYARASSADDLTRTFTCRQMGKGNVPPSSGIDIYYTMYWAKRVGSQLVQSSKTNQFFTVLD